MRSAVSLVLLPLIALSGEAAAAPTDDAASAASHAMDAANEARLLAASSPTEERFHAHARSAVDGAWGTHRDRARCVSGVPDSSTSKAGAEEGRVTFDAWTDGADRAGSSVDRTLHGDDVSIARLDHDISDVLERSQPYGAFDSLDHILFVFLEGDDTINAMAWAADAAIAPREAIKDRLACQPGRALGDTVLHGWDVTDRTGTATAHCAAAAIRCLRGASTDAIEPRRSYAEEIVCAWTGDCEVRPA